MDVVHILKKGRHDLRGLAVSLVAERAPEEPHRVTAVDVRFTVTGTVPEDTGAARDRPVAREILLGLALDSPGHHVQDPVQRGPGGMSGSAGRRTYLDLLRGVAVLIMIEAHVIDSWTRLADRGSAAFGRSLILGGFGAPLFLFLAGVSVALSASSKARRHGDEDQAAVAVEKRGTRDLRPGVSLPLSGVRCQPRRPHGRCSRSTSSTSWGRRSSSRPGSGGPHDRGEDGSWRSRRALRSSRSRRRSSARLRGWRPAGRSSKATSDRFRSSPTSPCSRGRHFVPAGAFVGVLIDDAREPAIERRLMVASWAGWCGDGTRRLLGVLLAVAIARTHGSGRPRQASFSCVSVCSSPRLRSRTPGSADPRPAAGGVRCSCSAAARCSSTGSTSRWSTGSSPRPFTVG